MNSDQATAHTSLLDAKQPPTHVAVIMDGNGRWAKKRLLSRIKGHEKGSDTVRTIVRTSREIGIGFLTLYAFSTENWRRPKGEINALMGLLKRFLKAEVREMVDNNIRLNTIGQVERLPDDVRQVLTDTMRTTEKNDGMVLTLALSYGARAEIVQMVQQLCKKVQNGTIQPEAIDTRQIAAHLHTRDMPDPDLLIRTSGEMRISNFLLWQIAYTELFVTDTLWPDFTKAEFLAILNAYQRRERRFGATGE